MNVDQIKFVIDNWNNLKWDLEERNNFIKSLSNMDLNILDANLQQKITFFLSQVNLSIKPSSINNANQILSVDEICQTIQSEKNTEIIQITKRVLSIIIIILIVIGNYFLYMEVRPKFKNLIIEVDTNKVSLETFLVSNRYKEHAKIITDLTKINFSEVSETDIKLSYKEKEEIVKLKIVDTKAPVVKFQDISRYSGYKVNASDFIVDETDLSEVNITATQIKDTTEYKDYVVEVTVKDIYGNQTTKNCILTITWLKPIVYVELGSEFSKEMIMENLEKHADNVSQSEIEKVNVMVPSEYVISSIYNDKSYTSKIIVQDTTPPELELKNLTIYVDNIVTKDNFIKYVKDASEVVTTTMKSNIDYTILGEQQINIEASDNSGNMIEKTATLTIIEDTVGPTFSRLKDLAVPKYSNINYNYDVTAIDDNDGNCKFSVDASKVNTSVAGTYFATYTSEDSKGNTTIAKRKVIINHDQSDTDQKFNTFYDNYLAGKDVLGMSSIIRTTIKYNTNWGGDDPVWYGLTENAGNCYIHALLLQKALNKVGITNRLINATDNSHYWNLIYINGIWRHFDATPGTNIMGPATDDEKSNSSAMKGRDWDRNAYPVAN